MALFMECESFPVVCSESSNTDTMEKNTRKRCSSRIRASKDLQDAIKGRETIIERGLSAENFKAEATENPIQAKTNQNKEERPARNLQVEQDSDNGPQEESHFSSRGIPCSENQVIGKEEIKTEEDYDEIKSDMFRKEEGTGKPEDSDNGDWENDDDQQENDAEDPSYSPEEEQQEVEETEKDRPKDGSKKTPKAQFLCKQCHRVFQYEKSYLKHIGTAHGPEGDVVHRCEICMQTFANRCNLRTHEKHVHSEERLCICGICFKTFKRKKDVVCHQKKVHGEKIRYICPNCGKSLSSKTALLLHGRTHTGTKPYECADCGARFTQKSALNSHRRTHTGEKPYACELCSARFAQKKRLAYHQRSHTGEKPFTCLACGKNFACKEYLKHHANIHTGSKPHKCEECGRCFGQRNSLYQHVKTHTGERPYTCTECNKQFTQLNALRRHHRIHTGEKPYMCGLCKRTFTDKSTLRRHTSIHDPDAPWKTFLVVLNENTEGKRSRYIYKEKTLSGNAESNSSNHDVLASSAPGNDPPSCTSTKITGAGDSSVEVPSTPNLFSIPVSVNHPMSSITKASTLLAPVSDSDAEDEIGCVAVGENIRIS